MEGNRQKMREALKSVLLDIGNYVTDGLEQIVVPIKGETVRKIKSAISEPIRNCDRFSTFDEAWDCWFNLPLEEIGGDYGIHHFVEWLFSPVTKEVEAENG